MLLDTLNSQGLLQITSVLGETSDKGIFAFRGDLVLKEGELREGSERDRKPAVAVVSAVAALTNETSFVFFNGLMYELEQLSMLVEKYKDSLTADTLVLMYVENIGEPMKVEYEGLTFNLLPYPGGMVWNELLDTLYIEKSDLKGQSAEDKVTVAYDAAKTFDIKKDAISYEAALENTIEVVKEMGVGPV